MDDKQQDSTNNSKHNNDNDSEWVSIDPTTCTGIYGLGISCVGPRPVAVITSQDGQGILNCAPFSYTGLLSHDPPMICHGLCLSRDGKKKDTLVNIETTQQWVMNVLSDHWLEQANQCSQAYPSDINELEMANLTTLPCTKIQIPRIEQAYVALECVLESTKEIRNPQTNKHTTTVVFGTVVNYHIHKSVLGGTKEKPVVLLDKIRFCGRVGDITYWPAGDGTAIPLKRP